MKKIVIFFLILFLSASAAFGVDLSMSFGPWSFLSGDAGISHGIYPYIGLNIGWNKYLESEIFVVAEAAPEPAGSLYFGGGLGSSLLGTRGLTYFNMYAQLDFLYGLNFNSGNIEHNRMLGARVSPLAIGNGYNGYRDRIFTVGAFYNFDSSEFSFTWNLLIFDIFLKWNEDCL